MQRQTQRPKLARMVLAALIVCALLLPCGTTTIAAEEGYPAIERASPTTAAPERLPPYPEDMPETPTPADERTVIDGGTRQIIRSYILSDNQKPTDIPRDSFELDGWHYTLADIIETRADRTESRSHTEMVEVKTDSDDLNEIVKILPTTMEYQSDDGCIGTLAIDVSSVSSKPEGYRNSSYTVAATREYMNLSSTDTSPIPKTIIENGRILTLEGVVWEAQHYINIDGEDIPDSYRATARYTAIISTTVATGYVTTADYIGEITKIVNGDLTCTAYFIGTETGAMQMPTQSPMPELTEAETEGTMPTAQDTNAKNTRPLVIIFAVIVAITWIATRIYKRRKTKNQ